ncbi:MULTISPECIES: hypothetical protein [Neobacillus]|jgi:hypothetical protein|uniref:Uncharacterized protein n=1 Tax=Neobacillus sedimentimangrovi TaxID=2699460 RepID=A0ABS8QJJ1_9BACI|nr:MULTISPECIES: hypothetical protein [Neobacillus]MCD4839421.1 hypothetical protein [Neobacillus sedimentimangrovi]MED3625101.1 hypothetical protein [Neobacillus thermocopriae]MED3714760.1 hypothetical protein [Neobacillus thermocopriae]
MFDDHQLKLEVRYTVQFTEEEINRIKALIPTKNISYLDLRILYKMERALQTLGEVY